jgi:3-phenylpropionate/trans-cinnamate dioxygenase ferredoxin component
VSTFVQSCHHSKWWHDCITMEWIRIFSTEAEARQKLLPDQPRLVIIGSKRICIVVHEEKFYAVQDSCTHNGESLSKGRINYLGEIICPWHGYRFALNSGMACDSSCRDLVTYPLKIDESGLYIGII